MADIKIAWAALDARKVGFAAVVIDDTCRTIDTQGSLEAAWKTMERPGVKRIQSGDVA